MRIKSIIFAVAFTIILVPLCNSQERKINEKVKSAVEVVLRAIEKPYRGDWNEIRLAPAIFDEALKTLSSKIDNDSQQWAREQEGNDIRAKLIVIAREKDLRPQVFTEIIENYPLDMRLAAPEPVPLRKEHVEGKYRLVWEYILLKSPSPMTERALDALGKIKDPNSILTILHCFRATSREGVPSRKVAGLQGQLLQTLAKFRDEEGLRALLECIWLSKKQQIAEGQEKADFDAESEVYNMLTGRYGPRFGQPHQWKRIIAEFLKASLIPEQAEFLQRVLKAE